MKKVLVAIVASLFMVSAVWAQVETGGTPKDAQLMLKKAVAYMKEVGKEKAIKEFGNPKGKFIYKDVYISVYDLKGGVINHPFTKALIGKNFIDLKDADGKPFVHEIMDKANSKGSGTVEYKWSHPNTKKVQSKIAYLEKVGDVILSGSAYK
ncbi:MAG: cache domain-containing protein [Syntrophales bacterium]|nr:cache domain-containing protein [Syntrophales bacterium]